jgi:hypothetical protein
MNNITREPPQVRPGQYGYINRVYKSSLRPVVLFISSLAGLWALISGVNAFRLLGQADSGNIPHLRTIALILGILYMIAVVIETFGVAAALTQRATMVRLYYFLSILSALLILGGSLVQTIVHFTMKDELINQCTSDESGATVFFSWGFWGSSSSTTLNAQDARNWCQSEWDHDSWADVVAFILELVLAVLFVSINFAYYKQVIDPTSPVNAARAPSNQIHLQPYGGRNDGGQFYPPPPGPPPNPGYYDQGFVPPYDASKPPRYGSDSDVKYEGDPDAKYLGDVKYGRDEMDSDTVDPFSDFDGPSKKDLSPEYEERDMTSRPRPGERDTF